MECPGHMTVQHYSLVGHLHDLVSQPLKVRLRGADVPVCQGHSVRGRLQSHWGLLGAAGGSEADDKSIGLAVLLCLITIPLNTTHPCLLPNLLPSYPSFPPSLPP